MKTLILIASCILLATLTRAFADDPNLVGYWRFDTAGAQAADLSGKGHPAAVTGGQIVTEDGKSFLRMDGKAGIEIPSAPELNVTRAFSIEARVRPSDLSDGRTIVFKRDEYMVRIDWPKETSQLSFFVFAGGEWEPRVSAAKPLEGQWLHIVAVWNGGQSFLWVNGVPHEVVRRGETPAATSNPVCIGSSVGFGSGFVGDIDYVKLYNRALLPGDVIKAAYQVGGRPTLPPVADTSFDFRTGAHGWAPRDGATVAPAPDGLAATAAQPSSLILHDHLDADVSKRDFISVRMSVDKGSRANLIFATSLGAARVPFQTIADGRMHTYVLEPWQHVGWGGKLLALGLAPTDVAQTSAKLQYLRITEAPSGEADVRLTNLYSESVLPRAGRPERITATFVNEGGDTKNVKLTLRVPDGVTLVGSTSQSCPKLAYHGEGRVSWTVRARAPQSGSFRADVSAETSPASSLDGTVTFQPPVLLPKASYVPEPVPVDTGKYMVLTHYCPLWKQGTHTGWKAIEPYPNRKPVLGWYNEGTPEVADWHIKQWLEHGIQGVVYCWYRSNLNGPVQQSLGHAIHDGLLKARYLPKIKFAIMWENGCGQGVGSMDDLMTNVLPFWLDNYFTNPSYLKIDGKPVLYVWVPGNVTRHLGGSDNVRKAFDMMRAKARERGLAGLYIVGCVGTGDKSALEQMAKEGWDASSAYGNGWYPPKVTKTVGKFNCAPVEGFIDQQESIWKAKTSFGLLPDITAAMMGWDSRPWNETPFFWSDNTPAKFRELCRRAKALMDSKPTDGPEKRTVIFCCWNEFGEGHYIEPTRGYGYSYLDAIRDTFGTAPAKHTDIAPADVGLGPYDSWYQQARAAAPISATSVQTSWSGAGMAAWTGFMGLDAVKTTAEGLSATSNTRDPALSSPSLILRANRYSRVVVRMKVSKPGDAQLFWATAAAGVSEASSLHVQAVADGQFHDYTFEVGKNPYWGGCVTGLRFDPSDVADDQIQIASIELR